MKTKFAVLLAACLLTGCASAQYSWIQDPHRPVPGQVDTYTFGVLYQYTDSEDSIIDAESRKVAEENMKKMSYTSYKITDKKCPAAVMVPALRCVYTVQYVR